MLISRRFRLGRPKMLGFLDELESASGEAESLYMPSGLSLPHIESLLQKVPDTQSIPSELAGIAAGSKTGAVLLWGSSGKYLVLPPFPIKEEYFFHGYDVEPLRYLLKHDFMVALILIRLGAYALGIGHGERLITSKVGTGLVHARHRKGGSSQRRFERHRENQIDQFLTRVCSRAQQQFEPHAGIIDHVVYGGARTTVLLLRKRCSFLHRFDHCTIPPLLSIPEPRKAILDTAIGHIWSSGVIEWYDDEVPARE